MKSEPNLFFRYLVFMFRELETILKKAPFQLVPQFTMKRRAITIGKEQVAELMMRLAETDGLVESLGIDLNAIPSREDVRTITFVPTTRNKGGKSSWSPVIGSVNVYRLWK
jgi:hypothetical protein